MSATCKCGTELDWARTESGSLMPVDHDSADKPGGNLAVWREGRELRCRMLGKDEVPDAGEHYGMSHWATCSHSREFKRRRHDD